MLRKMAGKIPTLKLPSGAEMPVVGLGTWKSKAGEVENAVKHAIDLGYRLIDCAMAYGNEKEVGCAIAEKIRDGVVKREDLFIISKLWNTRHSPGDVKPSLLESLSNLGLDYLDLYLIHWPHAFKPGKEMFPKDEQGNVIYSDTHPLDTYKALEKCVEEGLAKDIGLSNFNSEQVQNILDNCKIKPATNQVECHPYSANRKLAEFCAKRGVPLTAYSPLASADRAWAPKEETRLIDDPRLKVIADKHGKTPAQVVLRWFVQRGICTIPKSVTPSRIDENFDLFGFELSAEDMEAVDGLDRNTRLVVPMADVDGKRVYRDRNAPNFPFNIEF